jgi:hypothetical protein
MLLTVPYYLLMCCACSYNSCEIPCSEKLPKQGIAVPVQHIQTYLVHPGKGAAAVQQVNGTSLPLTGSMFDLLDGIYARSEQECDIDIIFKSTNGMQQHVARLDPLIQEWFRPIEYKEHIPESHWEFGYFGRHYILAIPTDVINPDWTKDMIPRFFELQVKTLFEHAWSEAEHDLGYKPGEDPLTSAQTRSLAYTSAQAWGADRMFEDLFQERSAAR